MRTFDRRKSADGGLGRLERITLLLLSGVLLVSFFYGWYVDPSKPVGGRGWADQSLYTRAAADLGSGRLPPAGALHYQMGYPLLGALGYQFMPSDPFMLVSLLLLLGSAAFGYLATRALLGWKAAALFTVVLFAWDLHGRSFNYPSELFVIPWNNQVLFFSFAFFFWLLAAPASRGGELAWWFYAAAGLVAGFTIGTREESVLFLIPLLVLFLMVSRAGPSKWGVCLALAFVGYLPHLAIKTLTLGDPVATGRQSSYGALIGRYLRWDRFLLNWVDVVFHAGVRGEEANRVALLQAAPWLWLSPVGLLAYLRDRTGSWPVKGFLLISVGLFLFYLAGANVSLHKLRFHCIRYLTPALIGFNFGAVYAFALGGSVGSRLVRSRRSPAPP